MHNPHGGGNTYELERALDEDMLLTSVGWANSYYQARRGLHRRVGRRLARRSPTTTPFGNGHYTEMVGHPLADDAAIDRYHAPDPTRPELYAEAERVLQRVQGRVLDRRRHGHHDLRDRLGAARLRADADGLGRGPDLAERILDIPYRYHLAAAKQLVEMGVDMIWLGDDVGAQRAMLISPGTGGASSSRAWPSSSPSSRRSTRRSRSPTTPTATSSRSSPS